jgi:hypothetical protein
MSEALDHVRQVCAEFDAANPGWREDARERQERQFEKQKRELAEAREGEVKQQQQASINWWAAIDDRINEHLKNWLWGAIDDRIQQHLDRHEDIFKDAVGAALGTIREQARDEFKGADEQLQRALEAKLAVVEERLASNDRVLIETTGGPQGQARLREELKRALNELTDAFGGQLVALEQRVRASPGKLPVAKLWQPDTVTYEAQVVSYDGASYQALQDTAQTPGGSDWVCIARSGRDGCDGLTLNVCGTFDAYKTYARLDVVEFDGSSFVALRDDPGIPGDDGWQILCNRGNRGAIGEVGPRGRKGERGARGEATPTIILWTIDRKRYRAIPTMSDGKVGAPLELRELFEQFVEETSYAAEARPGS